MLQQIRLTGIEIDTRNLLPKQELLDFLKDNGENDRALAGIREIYMLAFDNELIWRYPISDGKHAGAFIVAVQEGIHCNTYR